MGLETTIIGSSIEGDAVLVPGLEEVVDEDDQAEDSWRTFTAAIARGNANLKKHDKEFKDPQNHNYTLISVAKARNAGVLPIGFQSNQKFVDAPKDDENAEN